MILKVLLCNSGKTVAQLYSYPAIRWKRKKKSFLFINYGPPKQEEVETVESGKDSSPDEQYCIHIAE